MTESNIPVINLSENIYDKMYKKDKKSINKSINKHIKYANEYLTSNKSILNNPGIECEIILSKKK